MKKERASSWAIEFLEAHAIDEPAWAAAWPPDQAMRQKVDLLEED